MSRTTLILSAVFVFIAGAALPARADTFSFMHIMGNSAGAGGSVLNGGIGTSQLFLNVTDVGNNEVMFSFSNVGANASSITHVYFQDGTLFNVAVIDNGDPGVQFGEGARPAHLPGAKNLYPPMDYTMTFDADSPKTPNGVDPNESLGITVALLGGVTFQDVLDDLTTGHLRVGLKVQGFADGGSESFVNNTEPVPEPGTLISLSTFGLVGFGFSRWRRKQAVTA